MRFRILLLFVSLYMLTFSTSCTRTYSCIDGLQNQGETGIDCGGPCINCGFVASCFDGIQNQDETDIDCGGALCPDCPGTCSDGIMNQNETDIDCGGVCDPCSGAAPTCTDGIQNGSETAIDCGGPDCDPCAFDCDNPNTTDDILTATVGGNPFSSDISPVQTIMGNLVITGNSLDGNVLTLTHSGLLAVGTYPLGAAAFESGGTVWNTVIGGSGVISITSYDTTDCTMDGSFTFSAENSSGSTLDIASGIFENLNF